MARKRQFLRDLETLSAYLDEEISPKEREHLEARMRDDPELRSTLSELKQIHGVLKASPRVRSPRNFTLTPEMVGIRSAGSRLIFPAFRAASAVASLLFVFVVIGDLLGWVGVASTLPMDQVAREVVTVQDREFTPQLEIYEAPSAESLAEEPMAPEPVPGEGEFSVEIGDESEEAADTISEKSAQEESLESAPVLGEVEAPAAELQMAPEAEMAAEGQGIITEGESIPPEEQTGEENYASIPTVLEASPVNTETSIPSPEILETGIWLEDVPLETEQPPSVTVYEQVETEFTWPSIRLIEIILGAFAISTGLLAWYFHRRR